MLALRQSLFTFVTVTSSTSGFTTAIASKFYYGEAPQGTTGTYCVFIFPTTTPDYLFDCKCFENVIVQFNLFSDETSANNLDTAYGYLRTLFDNVKLTVTGYDHYQFEFDLTQEFPPDQNGIWQYSVQYRCVLYK